MENNVSTSRRVSERIQKKNCDEWGPDYILWNYAGALSRFLQLQYQIWSKSTTWFRNLNIRTDRRTVLRMSRSLLYTMCTEGIKTTIFLRYFSPYLQNKFTLHSGKFLSMAFERLFRSSKSSRKQKTSFNAVISPKTLLWYERKTATQSTV